MKVMLDQWRVRRRRNERHVNWLWVVGFTVYPTEPVRPVLEATFPPLVTRRHRLCAVGAARRMPSDC